MPKSKNLFFILLLLNLAWALPSCGPKDCHDDGTCPPEYYRFTLGEAKDYLWAKPGSYWIYKNTLNGALDTQTCTYFYFDSITVKGTQNHTQHVTVRYDRLKVDIYSSFNKWVYYRTTNPFSAESNKPWYYRIVLTTQVGGQGLIENYFSPFEKDVRYGTGSESTFFTGMDTTLTLQGKVYDKVAKFDVDIDDIWEEKLGCIRPNTIYYWAKNVGLVKKEMKRCNYSWELIDYNIIK